MTAEERAPASAAATPGEPRMLPVPDGLEGSRLDVALSRMFGVSRAAAAELVADGLVRVDDRPSDKSTRLRAGAWLEVRLPRLAAAPVAPPQPVPGLVVLHHDEDIVVVDKPVGVAAHPSPGWEGPTVVAGVTAMGLRLATAGAAERQGVVHRLDAGTTGVMVLAASEAAYSDLKEQFRSRTVHKEYHAVVQGHPDPTRGTIDAPIDRHPRHDWKFAVVATGRPSITHYDTVELFRGASLLRIRLETGRTHQIRVHMSAVRHPCAGDLTYGADPVLARRLGLNRQWLHAHRLSLRHPGTGRQVEFTSPYPEDLQAALDQLRGES